MSNFERHKVRLGDIAEVTAGQGAPQGDNSFGSVGVPFVRAGHLGELLSGKSELDLPRVKDEIAQARKLKVYRRGTILFAKSGMSCMKGYVYRLKQDSYVVSHLAVISPKNDDTGRFLEYYFRIRKPNLLVKDPAYPSISLMDIADIKLSLPPLAEQKRIAEELDNICAAKKDAEAIVEKLKLLAKSLFVEMFGDPLSQSGQLRLGDVCSMRAGKFISAKDIHEDGLFPCFGGNGIRGYVDNFSHEGTFPVVGRQGALCGNVQLAKGKFYATEHAVVVKPTKNWNPVFMFHLLIGLKLGRLATGAAQPGLAVNKIEEVQVSLPKMELQVEFAAFIEQLDKSLFEAQALIGKLDLLYRAKLQEYFG